MRRKIRVVVLILLSGLSNSVKKQYDLGERIAVTAEGQLIVGPHHTRLFQGTRTTRHRLAHQDVRPSG